MPVVASNLTQGPGTLYSGTFGTSVEPADSAVNTTPILTGGSTGWTDLGATDGGSKLSIDQKFAVLSCDQIIDDVGRRVTSREIMVDTNLAEPTLANLALSINGGTQATGSGWATLEPVNATSATQPTYVPVILDGYAPGNNFRRRVILRKTINTAKVELAYTKDKQTLIPVSFTAHYVSASVAPIHTVDQTS